MATQEYLPLFPRRVRWLWWPSALAGVIGLGLGYGFAEPVVPDQRIHQILTAAGVLFLLSRIMLLLPPVEIPARVGRCWLDFAILLAGAVWWGLDRSRDREVLEIIAAYSALAGFVAAARGGAKWLFEGPLPGVHPGPVRRLFLAGFVTAILGGLILSLPQCWGDAEPFATENSYPGQVRYEYGTHALNCLFISTSALTGTGLWIHDTGLGETFSLAGQIVILLLMQIGGMAVLAIGTVLGLRLRAILGWQTQPEDATPTGLRRAVRFSIALLLIVEIIGGAAMFFSQPDLFAAQETLASRIMGPVFHTISAICGVGLTLSEKSMVDARELPTTYAVILPLMVLGSIGGPTLFSLYRKLRDRGSSLPADVWLTLGATALVVVIGAGLLYGIESSRQWQLGVEQENTLGKLHWNGTSSAPSGEIVFSSSNSEKAAAERMWTMPRGQRIAAAFFQSVSVRSCGMRTVRLDNRSISPASRVVLMAWMLIGGSVGGAAGGLRLCVVGLMLLAIARPGRRLWRSETQLDAGSGRQALAAAGVVVSAMLLLVVLTTFVLAYRQNAPLEDCLFESVSACTNSGISSGLTARLPKEDRMSGPTTSNSTGSQADVPRHTWLRFTSRSMLILAMIFGRVLPLGILLRWTAVKEK